MGVGRDLESNPGAGEHGLDRFFGGEDVGNGGERDGGGGGGAGGVGDPEEAVGGEDEEARFEEREARVFFAVEVDGGEERALDLARVQNWAAAAGELGRR